MLSEESLTSIRHTKIKINSALISSSLGNKQLFKAISSAQKKIVEEIKRIPFASLLMFTSDFTKKRIELREFTEEALEEMRLSQIKENVNKSLNWLKTRRRINVLRYIVDHLKINCEVVNGYLNLSDADDIKIKEYLHDRIDKKIPRKTVSDLSPLAGTCVFRSIEKDPSTWHYEIFVKSLESSWLEGDYNGDISHADCIHMVLAHECAELIFQLNKRKVKDVAGKNYSPDQEIIVGEYFATEIGVGLYLHHATRHKKMHRVPRYYTSKDNKEVLLSVLFEAIKESKKYPIHSEEEWRKALSDSIDKAIESINNTFPNFLRECPLLHRVLNCPSGTALKCPSGNTLKDTCEYRTSPIYLRDENNTV
jgi:hypothetical protein